jgi:RNA polymerase sigma-B factor
MPLSDEPDPPLPPGRGVSAPATSGTERYADTADREALINSHLALARSLARRFSNRGESLDDLTQVAMLGLVKAAIRFDAGREYQFSTFATATITGELKRHFRDKRWGMHVTRTAQERYLRVRDATEWATQDLGRSPTIGEIAQRAGVSEEDVLEAQELAGAFHVDSIEGAAAGDDSGPGLQLGTLDPGMSGVENRLTISGLLAELPEREQRIIGLRFVDELTQSQIAAELGLSQMQVSRILSRTLSSLREALARS